MKFALQSNVPQFRPSLILFIFLSLSIFASACTTVPGNTQTSTRNEKLRIQDTYFQQAKQFFLDQQYASAANLLLPLARQGHRESQYVIGYMYHYGYGVPRNEKESTRWIATAAARGHVKAQQALQIINAAHDLGNMR